MRNALAYCTVVLLTDVLIFIFDALASLDKWIDIKVIKWKLTDKATQEINLILYLVRGSNQGK